MIIKYVRKTVNMKEVQYYNRKRLSHYAQDYWGKKESIVKDDEEVSYAHAGESDSEDVLLIANTQSNDEQVNMWYLDSGCNNHMIGNKNWFIELEESVKKVIKFAYGRHVT